MAAPGALRLEVKQCRGLVPNTNTSRSLERHVADISCICASRIVDSRLEMRRYRQLDLTDFAPGRT